LYKNISVDPTAHAARTYSYKDQQSTRADRLDFPVASLDTPQIGPELGSVHKRHPPHCARAEDAVF
jgi:hypothetical protein